jgi:hypothetical protein
MTRIIRLSERACEIQRKWRTEQLRAEVLAMRIPPEDEALIDEWCMSFVEGREGQALAQGRK